MAAIAGLVQPVTAGRAGLGLVPRSSAASRASGCVTSGRADLQAASLPAVPVLRLRGWGLASRWCWEGFGEDALFGCRVEEIEHERGDEF